MLSFIGLCLGIALLAAALTGPFVYLAFVPRERRKRVAAEGRATGLQAELAAVRLKATQDMQNAWGRAQGDIDNAWKRAHALEEELREYHQRDTIPTHVPEVPRRARTDTLVSE